MVVSKYPYIKLSRQTVLGKRLYSTPDGSAVASVTTILDKTKPKEKVQALHEWRKRVGTENAKLITSEAAGRGTRMHKFLEDYVKTDILSNPGSNPYSAQSHKMAQKIIDKGLSKITEFYGMEVSLYYPELYAGTTDLVGKYNNELSIIDYKQSNKPKKGEWIDDYKQQLCAYILAHNILYNTNIRRGIIFMCTPALEFQQFEVTSDDFDYWSNCWWDRVAEYYDCK